LAIYEAISLGKAIIATNVSGTKEVLGYGEYGFSKASGMTLYSSARASF
jgi:glycosyltransferase involved in cell wall biosynthesis